MEFASALASCETSARAPGSPAVNVVESFAEQLACGSVVAAGAGATNASDSTTVATPAGFRIATRIAGSFRRWTLWPTLRPHGRGENGAGHSHFSVLARIFPGGGWPYN